MNAKHNSRLIARVAAAFGLKVGVLLPVEPPGSPARTLYRCMIASEGAVYILEQVAAEAVPRKQQIAAVVARLRAAKLAGIVPFLEAKKGGHLARIGNSWWMAEPYESSDPLPRPDWVNEAPRGEALADWLLRLRRVTAGWQWPVGDVFALDLWLAQFITQLRQHDPAVLARGREPLLLTQRILLAAAHLPVAWAHGDFHPLNVLWRKKAVRAVIDWEFTGPKAELYDLANLIGCTGMEQPEALTGPFVLALVRRLRAKGYLSEQSWQILPSYVLALRFAWLSEWLREGDREMVALECDYLELLLARQEILAAAWSADRAPG